MKDITKIMNKYRECVRNLWNTYLIDLMPTENKWDYKDRFDEISVKLFSVFMSSCASHTDIQKSLSYSKEKKPIDTLCVVPKECGVPISINREIPPSGYWDYPKDMVKPDEVELRFIDYFDFDVLGHRDFEYYLVRIIKSRNDKEIKGRDALVQVRYADVFFTEL